MFKAIHSWMIGIPCLALLGVEQGLLGSEGGTKERVLVPLLKKLIDADFGFVIGFDADTARKKGVNQAQLVLIEAMRDYGCKRIYNISGFWHESQGKGIDDFIQQNGMGKFCDIFDQAEKIETWEKRAVKKFELKTKEVRQRELRERQMKANQVILKGINTNTNEPEKQAVDPEIVTTTPDDTILRSLFEDGQGDWTVIKDAYYQYTGSGYWSHTTDDIVQKLEFRLNWSQFLCLSPLSNPQKACESYAYGKSHPS
ncbi:DUF3854 domain-containing protein [Scytonema sp. UIC 10036]|nr:DUF3854 domain-containing protein [Scytonema sp. UIC 10036]